MNKVKITFGSIFLFIFITNANAVNWTDQSKVDKFTQQFTPSAIANFVDTDLPNILLQGVLTCEDESNKTILKLTAFTKKDNEALRYKTRLNIFALETIQFQMRIGDKIQTVSTSPHEYFNQIKISEFPYSPANKIIYKIPTESGDPVIEFNLNNSVVKKIISNCNELQQKKQTAIEVKKQEQIAQQRLKLQEENSKFDDLLTNPFKAIRTTNQSSSSTVNSNESSRNRPVVNTPNSNVPNSSITQSTKQTLTYSHGIYVGEVKKGKADGIGTYTSKQSGTVYSGQFVADTFSGIGTMTWTNGSKYVGEWSNDSGIKGVMTYADGRTATGTVKNAVFKVNATSSSAIDPEIALEQEIKRRREQERLERLVFQSQTVNTSSNADASKSLQIITSKQTLNNASADFNDNEISLRVYKTSWALVTKNLGKVSGNIKISFDWTLQADGWWEGPGVSVVTNGAKNFELANCNLLPTNPACGAVIASANDGGMPIKAFRTTSGKFEKIVNAHGETILNFFIVPSDHSKNGDHGNTRFNIKNLQITSN